MPVKAHDRRVVFRRTAAGLEYGVHEMLHRFSRMHLRPGLYQRFDVHSVALSHAVGEEHQSVTWLQRQALNPVFDVAHDSEGCVGLQRDASDATVAKPEWQRMTRVDDGRGLGA
jgi:hypothetical protein